jgi:glucosylceramidase
MSRLDAEKRREIARRYFHPAEGIGYSLCRTHMNSCDFSLGNYSCDDTDGDTELSRFSIERDKKYLIPFIREAGNVPAADFKLFASPWSPPAWMKTNRDMNNGGRLKPELRDAWARFYSRFTRAYEEEGIRLWGVTVQNEPNAVQTWDSCIYSAEEERDFVRDFLGPRLSRDGLDVKIMIWDHNRDLIRERATTILSDPEAAKYVWGIGFHWYSGEEFENVSLTHAAYPQKHLLLTEASIMGGVKLNLWDRGEIYAHHIINDLNNWAVGWVDWNMVLDLAGGPNHVSNFCDAPVIVDTERGIVHYQSSYFTMGHFSKFIRPGALRIGCASSSKRVETTAFRNPDGSVALVVMNASAERYPVTLSHDGRYAHAESPAHSIITFLMREG